MKHFALLCEFAGSEFHGWQQQDNAVSVQECLSKAWQQLTGEELSFRGCSRTDAGVSAKAHVADFHSPTSIPASRIPLALNPLLPLGLACLACREVAPAFDARFAARAKLYCYRFTRRAARPALARNFVAHVPGELNLDLLRAAAELLTGEHDFQAFMDLGTPTRNTRRRIDKIVCLSTPDCEELYCAGNAFLYHQVRIIAGSVLGVAKGKISLEQLALALATGERKLTGKTMPAAGLCLEKVYYEQELFAQDSMGAYYEQLANLA